MPMRNIAENGKKMNYTLGAGVTRSWYQQIGQEDYETYQFIHVSA